MSRLPDVESVMILHKKKNIYYFFRIVDFKIVEENNRAADHCVYYSMDSH